jgi:hypothetical protein
MLWLIVPPIAALMPVRPGTLWGDLLVELRRLASWIAPSSPLSLLVDWSWFSGVPDLAGPLSDRLRTMLAIQAAVFAFGLFGSVVGLRLREPHPTAWDPHRGYRPPVGDDPIYWREYELPRRGSRLPVAVILARQLLIIIRTLLLLTFQAVFLAVAVAIPIGLVIASGYYSYFAFREWWGFDPYPPGIGGSPRDQLNFFLRVVTSMLGLMPMLFAGGVADRIMVERNKKTWEPLLTTPLTGPEILRSKMRVSARITWSAIRWLIPLWLLGLACGGLHPLGALLAATGLAAGTWLNLAIGVRVAIRPGATTRSLNYVSVLWVLAMLPIGGLTIVAPLCSARDLDALRAIDPDLPWRAVAVLLAVALAMAGLAWSLIRRCFRRFDEWVGRPHHASEPLSEPVFRSTAADSAGILCR